MSVAEELNQAVRDYLRTATYPVAVKAQKDRCLPEGARRPLKSFGYPINICQGITLARRYGWTLGYLKEDHACGPALTVFGLVERPPFIEDGSIVYPLYAATPEAGARTQMATPSVPFGAIGGITLAPLHKATFDPDVVLIYGNPGQIARLIQGSLYERGGFVESRFMGRAACGSEIITPLLLQECCVTIPGGGEKAFALTCDDEMVFSVPAREIPGLINGLIRTHEAGASRMPTPFFGVRTKPVFPKEYRDLQEYCGLES